MKARFSPYPTRAKTGLARTARWFYMFNTQGGLIQCRDSDNPVSRLIWFVLFLIGAALTTSNLVATMRDIMEFKVRTDINMVQKEPGTELEFPAVTICNNNRVHCGNLRDLIEKCEDSCRDRVPVLCQMYLMGHCNVSVTVAERFSFSRRVSKPVCGEDQSNVTAIAQSLKLSMPDPDISRLPTLFMDLYISLTDEERLSIAHHPDSMFKLCSMGPSSLVLDNKVICRNISMFYTPKTGFCFAYNFVGVSSDVTPIGADFTGSDYGLTLEIDIEEQYYLRNELSPVAGIRVIVDRSSVFPDMNTGYDVAPNTQTSIMVSMTNVTRRPYPYTSNCTNQFLACPELKTKTAYNNRLCQEGCFLLYLKRACQCIMPEYAPPRLFGQDQSYSICNATYLSALSCYQNMVKPTPAELDSCQCHPACNELLYQTTISQGEWPSDTSITQIAAKYNVSYANYTIRTTVSEVLQVGQILEIGSLDDLGKIMHHVKNSFMRVQVYFGLFTVVELTESPIYDGVSAILSTFGGAISLFLGTSIISMFEMLELAVRLLISVFM